MLHTIARQPYRISRNASRTYRNLRRTLGRRISVRGTLYGIRYDLTHPHTGN